MAIAVAAVARLSNECPAPIVSEVTVAILIDLLEGRLAVVRSARLQPGFGFSATSASRSGSSSSVPS